jgi:hypothetical protein
MNDSNKLNQMWVDVMIHTYNPSYFGVRGRRVMNLKSVQAKVVTPYLKSKNKHKVLGTQLTCLSTCLPCMRLSV